MRLTFYGENKPSTALIAQLVECPFSESKVVGLNPGLHHTKGVKNGTSSSLDDARIKGVVLGRQSKAGKYLLKDIMLQ